MIHSFNCPESSVEGEPRYPGPLVFTWDDEAGTVDGPGAATLLALISGGWVSFGPHPRAAWTVGPGSLRSRADMAALIGHAWCVPQELVADYPVSDVGAPDVTYTDSTGMTHIGKDQMRF